MTKESIPFHRFSGIFPLSVGEEFDAIVEDIRAHGLREAIWVHPQDGSILDGRTRYRACLAADVEPKFRTWTGSGSALAFVISVNLHRRHLNASQRACLALEILPLLEEEARQRLVTSTGGEHPRPRQRIDQAAKGRAADKAAALANSNRQYITDAATLKKVEPILFKSVFAGELTIPEAKRKLKTQAKQELAEALSRTPIPLPDGKFRVIVADPPWEYDRSHCDYPSMPLESVKALPVASLCEEDCIVWLWTTNGMLREAFECLDAWRLEPKSMLTWAKPSPGVGLWLRGQTEHCLMAVRGTPAVTLTDQSTLLIAPRREHSRKPDQFFALVESLCPGSKLELFARERRRGWQAWGAELDKFAV